MHIRNIPLMLGQFDNHRSVVVELIEKVRNKN